jgi:hypothetical protein
MHEHPARAASHDTRGPAAIPFIVLSCALAALPVEASAQAHSDIYVAGLVRSDGGLVLGPYENVTRRAGYDNQPHFTLDGGAILYTRIDETGQADIWRYDLGARTSRALTRTAVESEYSATPLAEGGFTVVRVERDSVQRLWRFDDDGSNPSVVFEHVKPVGYHAWGDATRAAMFVLGQPATLQLGDTRTGSARVIVSSIGRAIQKVPGRAAISFLHMLTPPAGEPGAAGWLLKVLDVETGALTDLAAPPYYVETVGSREVVRAAEYHAWLPDGTLITAAGSRLYAWDAGSGGWTVIADVAGDDLHISRLSVSPDGTRLAFVGQSASR